MKKWAIIIDGYVMEFKFTDEKPKYPPDTKGNEVLSVECDDTVKLGMFYENGTFLWKENELTPPEPTQLDRIEEQQLILMEAQAEQYEQDLENRLNDMEVQATIYEAVLSLGGEK